jgi:hypothetical protein
MSSDLTATLRASEPRRGRENTWPPNKAKRTVFELLKYKPSDPNVKISGRLVVDDKVVDWEFGGKLVLNDRSPHSTIYDDMNDHMDGMSIFYRMLLAATGRREDQYMLNTLTPDERKRIKVFIVETE